MVVNSSDYAVGLRECIRQLYLTIFKKLTSKQKLFLTKAVGVSEVKIKCKMDDSMQNGTLALKARYRGFYCAICN